MTDAKYLRSYTSWQVIAGDGETILNHGWGSEERALEDAERHGGGAFVRRHDWQSEVCAYERELIDSGIGEEHWPLLRGEMQRMLNMARDAGRPSDAMRSAIRAFKAGNLTAETFAASKPSNYYPDDAR